MQQHGDGPGHQSPAGLINHGLAWNTATMSIVQASCDKWATTLTGFLTHPDVSEISFTSPESGEPAGSLTITEGSTASGARVRVVDTRLLIPALGLDATMVHAFAPSESTSPHLLSDLATKHRPTPDGGTEMTWHFHVDLMPRVDLIIDPEFIDAVYPSLTQAHTSAYAIEGMMPIAVPHRLRSLASPWLIGAIVRPTDEVVTRELFTTYANRWHELVNNPPLVADPASQRERDIKHRATMFNNDTDPVWQNLAKLVGQADTDTLLAAIRNPV